MTLKLIRTILTRLNISNVYTLRFNILLLAFSILACSPCTATTCATNSTTATSKFFSVITQIYSYIAYNTAITDSFMCHCVFLFK